jgi:hypothetical protein
VLDLLRHGHGRQRIEHDLGDGLGDGFSHTEDLLFEESGLRVLRFVCWCLWVRDEGSPFRDKV